MYRNASVIWRSVIRQPKASGTAPNPEKKAASLAASEQPLKKPATTKIAESSRGAEDYTRGAAIGREGGLKESECSLAAVPIKGKPLRVVREKRGSIESCGSCKEAGGAGAGAAQAEERAGKSGKSSVAAAA